MTDDAILANILRRGLSDHGFGYWFLGGEARPLGLTIDGQLELTPEELQALERALSPSDRS